MNIFNKLYRYLINRLPIPRAEFKSAIYRSTAFHELLGRIIDLEDSERIARLNMQKLKSKLSKIEKNNHEVALDSIRAVGELSTKVNDLSSLVHNLDYENTRQAELLERLALKLQDINDKISNRKKK